MKLMHWWKSSASDGRDGLTNLWLSLIVLVVLTVVSYPIALVVDWVGDYDLGTLDKLINIVFAIMTLLVAVVGYGLRTWWWAAAASAPFFMMAMRYATDWRDFLAYGAVNLGVAVAGVAIGKRRRNGWT